MIAYKALKIDQINRGLVSTKGFTFSKLGKLVFFWNTWRIGKSAAKQIINLT